VSNTPFRLYKHWIHEGGIAAPLIVHWPDGVGDKGTLRPQPGQLTDIMATCVEVGGVEYPETYNGNRIPPLEGTSLVPIFSDRDNGKPYLIWEHEGNCAVRRGKWKLVRCFPHSWELYDMVTDRTEMTDLASDNPGVVAELDAIYRDWAERCGIQPWEDILALRGVDRSIVEIPPEELPG